MSNDFPMRFLLATFGGWVNGQQADAIAYLVEENRVLKDSSTFASFSRELGGRSPVGVKPVDELRLRAQTGFEPGNEQRPDPPRFGTQQSRDHRHARHHHALAQKPDRGQVDVLGPDADFALFLIQHAARRVHIAGVTPNPTRRSWPRSPAI